MFMNRENMVTGKTRGTAVQLRLTAFPLTLVRVMCPTNICSVLTYLYFYAINFPVFVLCCRQLNTNLISGHCNGFL